MKADSELAAIYDATAEHWHDRLGLLGYPRAYEDLFDRLLADGRLRSLQDGGRVLDFGVGTGAFSLALAGKVAAPLDRGGGAQPERTSAGVPQPGPRGRRGPAAPARREGPAL